MATPEDSNALIAEANCYKCIPTGLQPQVQTYLLDQIRNTLSSGWDDLVFDPSRLSVPAAVQAGAFVATSGPSGDQSALRLTVVPATNNFWVNVQLPHTWVPRSTVHPHIHVSEQTANANNLVFTVAYTIAEINGTFPLDTTVAAMAASVPAGSQYKHLVFDLPEGGIDMSAFSTPSTILRFHYTLTSGGPIDVVSFDCHIFKTVSPTPNFVP